MNSFQDSVTRKTAQEVLRRNSHVEIQSMEHSVDGEDSLFRKNFSNRNKIDYSVQREQATQGQLKATKISLGRKTWR